MSTSELNQREAAFFVMARLMRAAATLLLAGIFAVLLLMMAPGRDADEEQLDPRLSHESVEALRKQRAGGTSLVWFRTQFLPRLARGDLGTSHVFNQPVHDLISDRAAITVRSVLAGLLAGWMAALIIAALTAPEGRDLARIGAVSASGVLLSVPSAVLAIVCLLLQLPPAYAIAAVVFPRVFAHADAQFRAGFRAPHVLMARSRGVAGTQLFFRHVLPVSAGPLIGLAGASTALAAGAAIPVEALADQPGLGQLAWRAAQGRDIPLLLAMTFLLATVAVAGNLICDLALLRLGARKS